MDNFSDAVQNIKDANPIEDVIADCGYKFQKEGGAYWRVPHEGGLVVNVAKQRFFHVSKGWNGDVVEFLMQDKGWEFKTAVDWLADRANLERVNWGKIDEKAMKAHRLKLSVFEIAHGLFQQWLWADAKALEYLRGRGFTDEIICGDVTAAAALDKESPYRFSAETMKKAKDIQDKNTIIVRGAGFGFSGRMKQEQITQMKGQFSLYGIAHDCPQAIVIFGLNGDVAAWADKWEIDRENKESGWDKFWEVKGRIHGIMNTPGIIYAHQWGGRVIYLTRRQLPGHDVIHEADGDHKWKSHNPQGIFVGKRQPYFNSIYRSDAVNCVIVEGPADAETFAMWGIPAVALCGVSADDEGIGVLKGLLKKHRHLFLALDDDKAGNKKMEKVAMAFGALIRLVDWQSMPTENTDTTDEANNDAE